jgi:hypothetical protein
MIPIGVLVVASCHSLHYDQLLLKFGATRPDPAAPLSLPGQLIPIGTRRP